MPIDTTDRPRVSDENLADFLSADGIKSYIAEDYLTFDIELALDLQDSRAEIASLKRQLDETRADEREECAQTACAAINIFQDIIGWQKDESRNKLVRDICEKTTGAIRAQKDYAR